MKPTCVSLYAGKTTTDGVKVLQYNVDQAMREEAYDTTKWIVRADRVAAIINEIDADLVSLNELRQLPGNGTVDQFLSRFTQYRYVVEYRNASRMSFGQAILYKPDKFYSLKTAKFWLSDSPKIPSDSFSKSAGGSTGFGYIVFGIKFARVREGKIASNEPFWFFTTHFGLEEELKTRSCEVLLREIPKIATRYQFILCGDFNFFPDRDGDKQRAMLTAEWHDLGKGAKTLSGKECEGTFVGYEHDEFKANLSNMVSRLDHIFASKGISGTNPTLYTKTMLATEPPELTARDYPSDHLPLVVDIAGL